jgi:hypothetical protein
MFVKHQCPQSCNIEKGYTLDYLIISNDQNNQIISSLVSAIDKPIQTQN